MKFDLTINRSDYFKIPAKSGIYVLLNSGKEILYVGKSKNLRTRIKLHLRAKSHKTTSLFSGNFEFISLLYHNDLKTLDEKETEIIQILRPILNKEKNENVQITFLEAVPVRPLEITKCCHHDCNNAARPSGYCWNHDPEIIREYIPNWMIKGKFITNEMHRLIYNMDHHNKSKPMYFHMSKYTFGRLLLEDTFADIESIGHKIIPKFKQHYIIIDEDDTIRLERWGRI